MSEDPHEDGYQIVQAFRNEFPKQFERTLINFKNNRYEQDMYQKHYENIPIWVFMEIIIFGTLSQFIDFYYKSHHWTNRKTLVILN